MSKFLLLLLAFFVGLVGFRYSTISTISSAQLSEQIQMQLRNGYNEHRLEAIKQAGDQGDWKSTFNNAANIFLTHIEISSIVSSRALFETGTQKHHILKATYFIEESDTAKVFSTVFYLAIFDETNKRWHLTNNPVNQMDFYFNNTSMW